jgi:type IV pilus assembly protein PilA
MPHGSTHPATSGPSGPSGFSLVELLVVVMIILVIAAIAIPGFVQARMKANEASAVSSMRTIRTAQVLYSEAYPQMGFSKTLVNLGPHGGTCESLSPSNACIISDEGLANGFKSGYVFELISDGQTPSVGYTLNGIPADAGLTGRCSFSSDQNGNISFGVPGSGAPLRYSLGSGSTSCDQ